MITMKKSCHTIVWCGSHFILRVSGGISGFLEGFKVPITVPAEKRMPYKVRDRETEHYLSGSSRLFDGLS